MGDRYIFNIAKSFIGKFGITWRDAQLFYESSHGLSAQVLYDHCSMVVRGEMRKMRPETLGKISVRGLSKDDPRTERQPRRSGVTDQGRTSLYSVHCGSYLDKYSSGRNILIELAVTAIVAEMTDQLREKMHRDASREALTSEDM